MPDLKNAIAESLPADVSPESLPADVNLESSPKETQPVDATTPKAVEKPVEKEVPFHEHPRWIERQRELEAERETKRQLAEQNAKLMSIIERSQASQTPAADPYDGMSEEQRAFYKDQDNRIEKKLAPLREENQRLKQDLETGKQLVTSLMYERFQERHPDIKSDSPEEQRIAQKVSMGHTLEDAYQLVMNPKGLSVLQEENKRLKQLLDEKKLNDKKAANLETNNVNLKQTSTLKGREKIGAFVDDFLKQAA